MPQPALYGATEEAESAFPPATGFCHFAAGEALILLWRRAADHVFIIEGTPKLPVDGQSLA